MALVDRFRESARIGFEDGVRARQRLNERLRGPGLFILIAGIILACWIVF